MTNLRRKQESIILGIGTFSETILEALEARLRNSQLQAHPKLVRFLFDQESFFVTEPDWSQTESKMLMGEIGFSKQLQVEISGSGKAKKLLENLLYRLLRHAYQVYGEWADSYEMGVDVYFVLNLNEKYGTPSMPSMRILFKILRQLELSLKRLDVQANIFILSIVDQQQAKTESELGKIQRHLKIFERTFLEKPKEFLIINRFYVIENRDLNSKIYTSADQQSQVYNLINILLFSPSRFEANHPSHRLYRALTDNTKPTEIFCSVGIKALEYPGFRILEYCINKMILEILNTIKKEIEEKEDLEQTKIWNNKIFDFIQSEIQEYVASNKEEKESVELLFKEWSDKHVSHDGLENIPTYRFLNSNKTLDEKFGQGFRTDYIEKLIAFQKHMESTEIHRLEKQLEGNLKRFQQRIFSFHYQNIASELIDPPLQVQKWQNLLENLQVHTDKINEDYDETKNMMHDCFATISQSEFDGQLKNLESEHEKVLQWLVDNPDKSQLHWFWALGTLMLALLLFVWNGDPLHPDYHPPWKPVFGFVESFIQWCVRHSLRLFPNVPPAFVAGGTAIFSAFGISAIGINAFRYFRMDNFEHTTKNMQRYLTQCIGSLKKHAEHVGKLVKLQSLNRMYKNYIQQLNRDIKYLNRFHELLVTSSSFIQQNLEALGFSERSSQYDFNLKIVKGDKNMTEWTESLFSVENIRSFYLDRMESKEQATPVHTIASEFVQTHEHSPLIYFKLDSDRDLITSHASIFTEPLSKNEFLLSRCEAFFSGFREFQLEDYIDVILQRLKKNHRIIFIQVRHESPQFRESWVFAPEKAHELLHEFFTQKLHSDFVPHDDPYMICQLEGLFDMSLWNLDLMKNAKQRKDTK